MALVGKWGGDGQLGLRLHKNVVSLTPVSDKTNNIGVFCGFLSLPLALVGRGVRSL